MRARTGLWEPRGGNALGPPGLYALCHGIADKLHHSGIVAPSNGSFGPRLLCVEVRLCRSRLAKIMADDVKKLRF